MKSESPDWNARTSLHDHAVMRRAISFASIRREGSRISFWVLACIHCTRPCVCVWFLQRKLCLKRRRSISPQLLHPHTLPWPTRTSQSLETLANLQILALPSSYYYWPRRRRACGRRDRLTFGENLAAVRLPACLSVCPDVREQPDLHKKPAASAARSALTGWNCAWM